MGTGILPWHICLGLGVLCLVLLGWARTRLERAREDWANAFFYSPSQKTKARQRRKAWQDRCLALILSALVFFGAAVALYVRGPA